MATKLQQQQAPNIQIMKNITWIILNEDKDIIMITSVNVANISEVKYEDNKCSLKMYSEDSDLPLFTRVKIDLL